MLEETELLRAERDALHEVLPGLDEALASVPLLELEKAPSPGIRLFREAGGSGLLVPKRHGGAGANAVGAVRVQRAIGRRSPSLAIAATMHHFSVASLVTLDEQSSGLEWMLLDAIARDKRLVASGFAEGNPSQGILSPTMRARRSTDGYIVVGSKKPCSLSHSMDLLTASVMVSPHGEDSGGLGVAIIPARDHRIERRPFWRSWALAGAESDEVVLNDVEIPEDLVFRMGTDTSGALDELQLVGFLWFELLVTASYIGAASILLEELLVAEKGPASERAEACAEVEAAMAAVEGLAGAVDRGERGEREFTRALLVRYATQSAIQRASCRAAELLGGMSFIGSEEVAYLLAATQALAFHPPPRARMGDEVMQLLKDGNRVTVP